MDMPGRYYIEEVFVLFCLEYVRNIDHQTLHPLIAAGV